mgnify:CR=1 FL=1
MTAQTNFVITNADPDEFLKKFVRVDEILVHRFDPELKRERIE